MIRAEHGPEKNLNIDARLAARISQTAPDVFLNELDITWMRGLSPMPEKLTILPAENALDDNTVTYSYNKQGFRSDNFTNNHQGKTHILFAGDSEAEGYGANMGEFWPSIIYNQLLGHDPSGFFNLSKGGWGWEKIIANSMIYFEKYGKPDYMFILLPNIARLWHYMGDSDGWFYMQKYIFDDSGMPTYSKWRERTGGKYPGEPEGISERIREYHKLNPHNRTEYMNSFIRFIAGWKLFLNYCKSENIKVFWSIWQADDAENVLKMYHFENFISLGSSDDNMMQAAIVAADKKEAGTLKENDIRRRDDHNGTIMHQIWADKLLSGVEKLGIKI